MKMFLARLVLSLVTVCTVRGHGDRAGHHRFTQRQNFQRAAAGRARRECHRDPLALRHHLRNDVPFGWPLRHPQHARRRTVLGHRGVHRTGTAAFAPETQDNVEIDLGVAQDLTFTLKVATVAETVTVVGTSDPVFSSARTGAATAVTREDLATLPTISGRITDITRLTPQYGGNGSFAGQDNRANNMTVDGSYFNNSFGLGVTTGGIGDRTGVAPISLEAIEQVQVSVAPYDVRQGNFIGAGVNTVTRSGTNTFTASVYRRMRNESFVGTEAARQCLQPGHLRHQAGRPVGRRPDREEQAVRLRQLRESRRTRGR